MSGPGRIFVSYSHQDARRVVPIVDLLLEAGFDVWYDERLTPGVDWNDALARVIESCAICVYFVSHASVRSSVCEREVSLAVRRDRKVLPVYLEDAALSPTLELGIGNLQAIKRASGSSTALFQDILPVITAAVGQTDGSEDWDGRRQPVHGAKTSPKRWRNSVSIVLAAVVAAGIYLFWNSFIRSVDVAASPRVAVLAFENFTGDPANDYLGNGLAEELLDALAQLEGLHVIPRTASFYFRGKDVPFESITESLGANVVLEGSVLNRDGESLRISTQLIDVSTNAHIWSDIYEVQIGGLIAVKSDIAKKVLTALGISGPVAAALPNVSGDAYDLYLRGKEILRTHVTRQDQEASEANFQGALDLEPSFRPALSGLCQIRLEMYVLSRSMDDYQNGIRTCTRLLGDDTVSVDALVAIGTLNRLNNNIDDALRRFEAALEIDPDNEPALNGASRCFEVKRDFVNAERYAKRAITSQPHYWKTYTGYAGLLYRQGRYLEAAEQSRRVTELTPDNPVGWGNMGVALFAADRWEEAGNAWQRSFSLERTRHGFANLATLFYYQHRFAEARDTLEAGITDYPDDYRLLGKLGAVYRALSDEPRARSMYERAHNVTSDALLVNADDEILLGHHAYFAAALGRSEDALAAIERAKVLQPGNPEVYYLDGYVNRLLATAEGWQSSVCKAVELGYSKRQAESDPLFEPGLSCRV